MQLELQQVVKENLRLNKKSKLMNKLKKINKFLMCCQVHMKVEDHKEKAKLMLVVNCNL